MTMKLNDAVFDHEPHPRSTGLQEATNKHTKSERRRQVNPDDGDD